jgi:hypothetical protein
MPLDERTRLLMIEAFGSEKCTKCDNPSTRRLHGKFYCAEHAPGRRKDSQETREAKRKDSIGSARQLGNNRYLKGD